MGDFHFPFPFNFLQCNQSLGDQSLQLNCIH